jgi:hypothetical protein
MAIRAAKTTDIDALLEALIREQGRARPRTRLLDALAIKIVRLLRARAQQSL